jgi:hypothetical protein
LGAAGLDSVFLLGRLDEDLPDADTFRFNINNKTQILRFSSVKNGRFYPTHAAASDECAFTH